MKLERAALERFAAPPVRIAAFSRIIAARHAGTPLGTGYGSSRFSSPTRQYQLLYAAATFRTAFAEAVVRDRLEGRARRFLAATTLDNFAITQIASTRPLKILDLTGDRAYRLGVNTDAVRGRSHQPGQLFADALFGQTDFEAIAYQSRLTDELCLAIFDRALSALVGTPARPLYTVGDLSAEIARLGIVVRRRRGP